MNSVIADAQNFQVGFSATDDPNAFVEFCLAPDSAETAPFSADASVIDISAVTFDKTDLRSTTSITIDFSVRAGVTIGGSLF